MGLEHNIVLMKYFIESQFAYCPLEWMCCDKTSDNLIIYLHEFALRKVCNHNQDLQNFRKKNSPVTIHVGICRILTTALQNKENLAASILY